ncbi:MAG: hypothetical protein C5B49_08025 [Bdellovibrio sp.]|nr:MAG: hypothetical protein C5B49_08025 [Bdellovibrio sp.]
MSRLVSVLGSLFVFLLGILANPNLAHSQQQNPAASIPVGNNASYLISLFPAGGPRFHSGDQVTITGLIKLVNNFGADSASAGNSTLLDQFKRQGIDIIGSFPSEALDVSSSLKLQSVSPSIIQFTYVTSPIQPQDPNQFSLKLFNHQNGHPVSNQDLLSQNTLALQVDNLTSKESLTSLVISGFRYSINSSIGTAIEGMSPLITGTITNLQASAASSGQNPGAQVSTGRNRLVEFVFNNQVVFSQNVSLAPGETVSYQYQAPRLKASNPNQFTINLYSTTGKGTPSKLASFSAPIAVASDPVAPQWNANSLPNAKSPYVQNMGAIDLIVSDSFGRIDASSFSVSLSGTTTSGSNVNLNLSSLTGISSADGASFEWKGPGQNLAEGNYILSANVKDLAGNTAPPYQISFTVVRTAPQILLGIGTSAILTNQYQISIPVNITDVAPVTTTFTVDDPQVYTFSGNQFTATIPLAFEGTNSISVVSQDAAGNVSAPFEFAVIRDTISPVLTQVLPAMNAVFYTNSLPYTITVSGISNEPLSKVSINGISASLAADRLSYQAQVPILAGQDLISVIGTDLAGNPTTLLSSVSLIYSNLPPVISLGLLGPIITNKTALNLPITVSDSVPVTTTISVNGTSVFQTTDNSFLYPLSLTGAGSYAILVQSIDLAGNSSWQTLAVTVDTTPPVITLTSQTTWPSKTQTVTGTLNKKVASVSVNDTAATLDASGTSFSAVVTLPGFGNQSLMISAVDLAGNLGTASVPILVQSGTIAGENPSYAWKYQECSLSGGL